MDVFISQNAESGYRASSKCKIGDPNKDKMAVVDPGTNLIGIDNLRVVDPSIISSVKTVNLNAPTVTIAERASDLIQGNSTLKPVEVPVYEPHTIDNYIHQGDSYCFQ